MLGKSKLGVEWKKAEEKNRRKDIFLMPLWWEKWVKMSKIEKKV